MERGDSAAAEANASTRFHLADAVAEWRSREQLEPSVPSTSPSYFDSDDDEGSALSSLPGPKPADLYGKFTWKIEHFSEISKRELRSNIFEVGGYKWYILVYPQGCDVCNHLSLFLCVADYDKLLPGWSHFAQFTIAVVNKDPKKSKYSDTLHRFCKKEHDWGWKKFMELSKVLDGFTVGDTLIIKAQVQVIRENPHRPFRCLDAQYRRELVRVYLTNVEGICRRFVEEKREKLAKVIEDTLRWSSFRAFWAAVEENARRRLAREKTDIIFKAVVKRFFNEKEVTSTLVMDALYSGCKALDCSNKSKKPKTGTAEEAFTPVVWMEKEFFVLAGDILSLLERAVLEPLPSYKDEKGPQNRTKEGFVGDDFGKDYVERDERRLTELGRRTVEMFVLAHLFSNRIEVAYREAVALKRQEELIREEEAAGQAEIELKAKREAAEKEKRSKKKQAKQRRKDRRGKDKDPHEKHQPDIANARVGAKQILTDELSSYLLVEPGDDEGDSGPDIVDNVVGTLGPAAEDLEAVAWEREAVFVHQEMEASFSGSLSEEAGGQSKRTPTALDDSSSTCSSDSLPSVRPTTSNSFAARGSVSVLARGRNRAAVDGFDTDGRLLEGDAVLRTSSRNTGETSSSSSPTVGDAEAVILSLKDRVRWLESRLQEKEEEAVLLHEQLSLLQLKVADQKRSNEAAAPEETVSSNHTNLRNENDAEYVRRPAKGGSQSKGGKFSTANGTTNKHSWALENGHHHAYEASRAGSSRSRTGGDSMKASPQKPDSESSSDRHSVAAGAAPFSRPSTAPIVPNGPRLSTPFPTLQAAAAPPLLARSISAAGRLNEPPSEAPQPLSYRNAAVGKLHGYAQSAGNHTNQAYFRPQVVTSSSSTPATSAAAANIAPASTSPSKLPVVHEQPKAEEAPSTTTVDMESGKAVQQKNEKDVGITFGTVTQDVLHSEQQQQRVEEEAEAGENNDFQRQASPTVASVTSPEDRSPSSTGLDSAGVVHQHHNGSSGFGLTLLSEDFPHLDIINDLLDDDRCLGRRSLSAILHPGSSNSSSSSSSFHEGADERQQQARRMVGDRDASMMPSYVGDAAGNGIPPRFWPLSRSMSVNGVAYRPEAQGRYPLAHVLVPEGYSVYAPLQ